MRSFGVVANTILPAANRGSNSRRRRSTETFIFILAWRCGTESSAGCDCCSELFLFLQLTWKLPATSFFPPPWVHFVHVSVPECLAFCCCCLLYRHNFIDRTPAPPHPFCPHLQYYKYSKITTKWAGLASGNAVMQPANTTKTRPSPLVTGKADVGASFEAGCVEWRNHHRFD